MKKMLSSFLIGLILNISIVSNIETIKKWNLNSIQINTYSLNTNTSQQYKDSFNTMIEKMIEKKDLLYTNPKDKNNNNEFFKVANPNNSNKYLIIKESFQNKEINFIIEPNYWYLDGFIPVNQKSDLTYYHFSKAKVTSLPFVKKNINLTYNGDYYSLAGKTNDVEINKNEISKSFLTLYNTKNTSDFKTLKKSLITAIFKINEALRFFTVKNSIINVLSTSSSFSWRTIFLNNVLRNWAKFSNQYYDNNKTNAKANITILNLKKLKKYSNTTI